MDRGKGEESAGRVGDKGVIYWKEGGGGGSRQRSYKRKGKGWGEETRERLAKISIRYRRGIRRRGLEKLEKKEGEKRVEGETSRLGEEGKRLAKKGEKKGSRGKTISLREGMT